MIPEWRVRKIEIIIGRVSGCETRMKREKQQIVNEKISEKEREGVCL